VERVTLIEQSLARWLTTGRREPETVSLQRARPFFDRATSSALPTSVLPTTSAFEPRVFDVFNNLGFLHH